MATADSWWGVGGHCINSSSSSHILVAFPVVVMEAGSDTDTHDVGRGCSWAIGGRLAFGGFMSWCIKSLKKRTKLTNTGCLHRLFHLWLLWHGGAPEAQSVLGTSLSSCGGKWFSQELKTEQTQCSREVLGEYLVGWYQLIINKKKSRYTPVLISLFKPWPVLQPSMCLTEPSPNLLWG